MNNNVFFDLSKKYNNIPNNSHVRCCQFILVGTLSLVFALIGPPCLLTLSSQFLLSGNAEKGIAATEVDT